MNPSERIDELIVGLTDWRGKTFASIRKLEGLPLPLCSGLQSHYTP